MPMLNLWQAGILVFFWIAVLAAVYRMGWDTADMQQLPDVNVCEAADAK
jgi:hypothetical protein